jgi:hypothetical protein
VPRSSDSPHSQARPLAASANASASTPHRSSRHHRGDRGLQCVDALGRHDRDCLAAAMAVATVRHRQRATAAISVTRSTAGLRAIAFDGSASPMRAQRPHRNFVPACSTERRSPIHYPPPRRAFQNAATPLQRRRRRSNDRSFAGVSAAAAEPMASAHVSCALAPCAPRADPD